MNATQKDVNLQATFGKISFALTLLHSKTKNHKSLSDVIEKAAGYLKMLGE